MSSTGSVFPTVLAHWMFFCRNHILLPVPDYKSEYMSLQVTSQVKEHLTVFATLRCCAAGKQPVVKKISHLLQPVHRTQQAA